MKSCKYWMNVGKLSNKMTTFFGCTSIKYVSSWKLPGLERPKKSFWFIWSHNNKCLSHTQSYSSRMILSSHKSIVFVRKHCFTDVEEKNNLVESSAHLSGKFPVFQLWSSKILFLAVLPRTQKSCVKKKKKTIVFNRVKIWSSSYCVPGTG